MRRFSLALIVLAACSPSGRGPGTMNNDLDASTGGEDLPAAFPAGSFGASCAGVATVITGIVKAPNGVDPVPLARVAIVAKVTPAVPGVACEICGGATDTALSATVSGADGTFSLNIDFVPTTTMVQLVVSKGRFRRVTMVAVTACGKVTPADAALTLPGSAKDGDIPKIAVATGNTDHLDVVLDSLGIKEFDCYTGTKTPPTGASTTPCASNSPDVETLLGAPTKLASYNMLFLSCAPGKFASLSNQPAITTNLEAWVRAGGRLFVTDESYDYVEQAFPPSIDFYPGSMTPAAAQPIDQGNLGVGASLKSGGASYMGTITDPDLQTWLQAIGVIPPEANGLELTGFLNPWAAQKAVAMGVKTEVTALASYYTTAATAIGSPSAMATMPMTVEWDYQMCGRVLFSSYHTLSTTASGTKLSAQEKILEYLMLDISSCVGPIG